MTNTSKTFPKLVVLKSGEQLENPVKRMEGVLTDAGLIAWEDVAAFRNYVEYLGRYVTVPMD